MESHKQPLKQVFSVPELAEILGISITTAWNLVRERKIAHHRIGKRVFVTQPQVDELLVKNQVDSFDAKACARNIIDESRRPKK